MMDDLTLCPLCGGKAAIKRDAIVTYLFYAECDGCRAKSAHASSAEAAAASWERFCDTNVQLKMEGM